MYEKLKSKIHERWWTKKLISPKLKQHETKHNHNSVKSKHKLKVKRTWD